jgi:hypothetical protein
MTIAAISVGICASTSLLLAADAPPKSIEATARPPAKPDEPIVVKLTLHPAKPPAAALEYPLLPRFVDQTSGNAAMLYSKTIISLTDRKEPNDFWDKVDRWSAMPPAELPKSDVYNALAKFHEVLKMTKMAARRSNCDWEPPIHEQEDIFSILLPEMQQLREIGRLLALRARLEIAEGHPAEALETLQTGYSLARHTADCPFVICGLVGAAISGMMDNQLETLVQSPNCPNLYWSITALPNPLIDLRPGLGLEADSLFLEFPELRDLEHARHTPEEWESILVRFGQRWRLIAAMGGEGGSSLEQIGMTAFMTGRAMALFPRAKLELVAAGHDRKTVDAMPAAQVILLHMVMTFKRSRDEMFKWFNLPYWQARVGMEDTDRKLSREIREQELVPVASVLLPALSSVRLASVRSERRIALLRVIEALRFYAAEHDGKLPEALDNIKEVPLPVDPVSGKPFGYKLGDGKATLDAPPPAGETWLSLGTRCEVTIAK